MIDRKAIEAPIALVIDVGSSSVRAVLYDAHLQVIAQVAQNYHFTVGADGESTADPVALRRLIELCIDQILVDITLPIACVGMCTFVSNFLGVDASGAPVTPISTYADTRAAAQLDALRALIDGEANHQRTGCPHHTAYHPARLRWFAEHRIGAARWIDVATYCYESWFGVPSPCSYSIASWSGLLNRATLGWDRDWLDLLHLTLDQLPALADFDGGFAGDHLITDYRKRWPLLTGATFYLAIGDGAAANVGTRAAPGAIALTVGTTAALRIISEALGRPPPVPAGLWAYRVTAAQHVIGGATTEGGNIYTWARATLQLPAPAAIETWIAARLPGDIQASALTILPFLGGERSPGYRAAAVGTIHGLRFSTTPLAILAAALESVALRLAIIADLLTAPDSGQAVYAGGGALAASPAWAQIMADALDRPLHLLADHETTARGVAMLILGHHLRLPADRFPAARLAGTLQPRPAFAEALRSAKARQTALYDQSHLFTVP